MPQQVGPYSWHSRLSEYNQDNGKNDTKFLPTLGKIAGESWGLSADVDDTTDTGTHAPRRCVHYGVFEDPRSCVGLSRAR